MLCSEINHCVENVTISPHLAARVYAPLETQGSLLPVGIYFHGGGWSCGDLDSEDSVCQLISEHLPCTIVSVDYRLAPEYKSPTQLTDALEGWNWVRCLR